MPVIHSDTYARSLHGLPRAEQLAWEQDVGPLEALLRSISSKQLMAVGSGGSLTVAQLAAQLHRQYAERLSEAVAPLEATLRRRTHDTAAILFSARGRNPDILRALRALRNKDFSAVGVVCATRGSVLASEARKYNDAQVIEGPFDRRVDRFLATQSLVSTAILITRAFSNVYGFSFSSQTGLSDPPIWYVHPERYPALCRVIEQEYLLALGTSWAWPAVVDIESKFAEAAIGPVLVSDIRNFAHGRHVWIQAKRSSSGLVVLQGPESAPIADRLLKQFPSSLPTFALTTDQPGPIGAIHLLCQSLYLVGLSAQARGLDADRPKVPQFGRRLYWGNFAAAPKPRQRDVWVSRKLEAAGLPGSAAPIYETGLRDFRRTLRSARISALLCDYDGTLCDTTRRYEPPDARVLNEIRHLIDQGLWLGIASGRGSSVRNALREGLPEHQWDRVVVGLYNGAVIARLSDEASPPKLPSSASLIRLAQRLRSMVPKEACKVDTRATQISITPVQPGRIESLAEWLRELTEGEDLQVVTSSHSVDILRKGVSKLNVSHELKVLAGIDDNNSVLCVGDRGAMGGNDYSLLSLPMSLSVDQVSGNPNTCWHLAPPGVFGVEGLIYYLRRIEKADDGGSHFVFRVPS